MDASALIPVHVLTGALGSGKTTLLNKTLQAGLVPDTAVIVNEFGAVSLDQLFVQARSEDTVVLQGGCVCCTIRTDLVSTLMQLLALRPISRPFRRILIETSGISDPLPILQTLRSEPSLTAHFRIGSLIRSVGAIDGVPGGDRTETVRQITAADAIVITKRDLTDDDSAVVVERAVTALNPLAQMLPRSGAEVRQWLEQWEQRNGDAGGLLHRLDLPAGTTYDAHRVHSTVIRGTAPASWPRLAVWLSRLIFVHGDRILRTKGVLFDAGRGTWIAVHGVRRFLHPPVHLDLAQPPPCGACLVFITEDLDPTSIERSYERLVAQEESARPAPERSFPTRPSSFGDDGSGFPAYIP